MTAVNNILAKQEVEGHIHPNTLRFYDIPDTAKINSVSPLELINSKRLDIVARYIYAKTYISGIGHQWGKHVYSDLIKSQTNNFTKGDLDPGKSNIEEYCEQFDALIDSIKK